MKAAILILGAAATVVVAGCGSSSSTTGAASSTGGGGNGAGAGRRGAAGELAQINGTKLILNSQSGDITVDTTASTTVQRTSTGTVADIVAGSCIVASGTKDAAGAITAQTVRVTAKQNGTCATGRPGGAPGGPPGAGNRDPNRSPNPSGNPGLPANAAFVAGEVTTVNGTSVSVQPATGAAQTITVPTTVRVSKSTTGAFSDLAVGNCVQANGTRDSSGTVKATTLNVVPTGPSGCFTGGGFGGFGGGGRRGAAGGGAAGQVN